MVKAIEELQDLSREELIQQWKKLFGTNSPQYAKKDLLVKYIAWGFQAKEQGGLSAQAKKQLEKLAEKMNQKQEVNEADIKETCKNTTLEIKAGTKLIREYQGGKYEVIALDKGFEHNGKQYNSLSAIANEITGTRWNGKVFFGVKK